MKSGLLLFLCCALLVNASFAGNPERVRSLNAEHLQTGLHFKENKSQWHANVLFKLEAEGANVFLERNAITYVLYNADELGKYDPRHNPNGGDVTVHGHVYKVELVGANAPRKIETDGQTDEYFNYFKGNDPSKWAGGVRGYTSILYRDVYPGIDLHYYIADGLVKYDFILKPEADPSLIKLRYNGADGLSMENGNVYVQTSVGHSVEMAPHSVQRDGSVVKSRYKLQGNEVTFEFPEGYNKYQQLTIDPTLIFSTYTGSTADNFGFTATYDQQGNMFLAGLVNANIGDYPTTTGAFQLTFGGGTTTSGTGYETDMGITKFNADGTARIFSTYLGGNDNDTPHSMFVNTLGQLVVYGRTYSPNFPTTATAYDNTYNFAGDISVTVFNVDGTALVGSTFVGGDGEDGTNGTASPTLGTDLKRNYADDARGEVVCDASNNIYVAACTFSPDFPVTAGAVQPIYGGFQDGVAFKLNADASNLIYATYLGGTQADACYSLDLKTSDGTVYISGGTRSNDFPLAASGGLNPAFLGGYSDGFLLRLNANATAVLNATFLGTSAEDQSYFVKLDVNENVYACGTTYGAYPVSTGVYTNPNSGQFITKLPPELDNIIYSTVVGNGNNEPNLSITAFLVDTCENVYVCGWGGNLNFTPPFQTNDMFGLPVTSDAIKSTTDGGDFYVFVLNKDALALLYGSYFGGNSVNEHVDGGTSRFDPNGVIYEAVCASCGGQQSGPPGSATWLSFGTPVTAGVVGPTNNSTNCNALGFKLDLELYRVIAEALANPAATGCAPLTVFFENTSVNATSYFWDFGTGIPGDTSIAFQPTFTFDSVGTYPVMLIAYSGTACIPVDTAYTSVVVLDNITSADYTADAVDMCDSLLVSFNVTNSSPTMEFSWDFGNGQISNSLNPTFTYYEPGTYEVTLIVYDSMSCNPHDTVVSTIEWTSPVTASISIDTASGCAPITVQFNASGFGATGYTWIFGDGTTSTDSVITHTYTTAGDYSAMLVATNPLSCNVTDTAVTLINVFDGPPTASFTFTQSPDNPRGFTFTNQSTGANHYIWNFGDGTLPVTDVNPFHVFPGTGSFDVCLEAFNDGPCSDDTCQRIDIDLFPAIDVPNAFSPNGDGQNDILYVRGQNIQTMLFKVFNRWGEKVFETNDPAIGWDGVYKKSPQEMDVFAWTLEAILDDGNVVDRKGNVTLIR